MGSVSSLKFCFCTNFRPTCIFAIEAINNWITGAWLVNRVVFKKMCHLFQVMLKTLKIQNWDLSKETDCMFYYLRPHTPPTGLKQTHGQRQNNKRSNTIFSKNLLWNARLCKPQIKTKISLSDLKPSKTFFDWYVKTSTAIKYIHVDNTALLKSYQVLVHMNFMKWNAKRKHDRFLSFHLS